MHKGAQEQNAAQKAAQAWSRPQPPQLWRDWHHVVVLSELRLRGRKPRACAVAEMSSLANERQQRSSRAVRCAWQELGGPRAVVCASLGPAGSCQADVVHRAASAYRGGGDLVEGGALCGVYGEHAVKQRDERR